MESFFDSFLRRLLSKGCEYKSRILGSVPDRLWINKYDRHTGNWIRFERSTKDIFPSNLQSGLFPSTIKNKTKSHLAGDRGNDSRDRENNKPNRRERWWTGAEIYETAADLQEDRARPRKIGLLDDTV